MKPLLLTSLALAGALSAAELKFNVSTSTGLVDPQHVATDAQGNTYVAGTSSSPTATFLHGDRGGASDVRVVKLDPNGQTVWSAMVGGLGTDVAKGIAVDPAGAIYVAVATASTAGWPGAPANSTFQATLPVIPMAFSLSNNGALVRYSSLHPGTAGAASLQRNPPIGINADASGNAYLVTGSVFTNTSTQTIKLGPTGAILFSPHGGDSNPLTFAAGPSGFLVVHANGRLLQSDGLGQTIFQGFLPTALTNPRLALDTSGNGDFYLAGIQGDGRLFLQKRNQNRTILRETVFGTSLANLGGVSHNSRGEIWLMGQTTSQSYPQIQAFAAASGKQIESFVTMFDATFVAQLSSYVPTARPSSVAADALGASFAIGGSHAGRISSSEISDMTVSAICGPRSGNTSTCTGTVLNLGPGSGRGVRVAFLAPVTAALPFTMTPTQGSCSVTTSGQLRIVQCLLGDILSGGSAQISITPASVPAGTLGRWTVVVNGSTDPNSANNGANANFN